MKLECLYEDYDFKKTLKGMGVGATLGAAGMAPFLYSGHTDDPSPKSPSAAVDDDESGGYHQEPRVERGIDTNYIAKYVKEHEGFRNRVYDDGVGNLTIGVGHLITPKSRQIFDDLFGDSVDYDNIIAGRDALSDKQVLKLFKHDLKEHIERARRLIGDFDEYPDYMQAALVDAVYRGDLGPRTRSLLNQGKYREAAVEYLNHNQYRNARELGIPGIITRMNKNRDAMLKYAGN